LIPRRKLRVVSRAAAAAHRRLDWRSFKVSVRQTLRFTVMTLFIVCGSVKFSQIPAFAQASNGLSERVTDSGLAPLIVLFGTLAALMLLGCFVDQVSMMMIAAPLFMPVAEQLGLIPIWFGVLTLMILEIGLAPPP
jgi:TRAP-type C4-dicarboxylate transport system permease large subunit